MTADGQIPVASPSRRAPAVPVILAGAAGIVADFYWKWPLLSSLILAACSLGLWTVAFLASRSWTRLRWPASALLLVACGFLAAAWHQFHWSLIRADDLLAFATDVPRPARLRAIVASDPGVIQPEPDDFPTALPKRPRTIANLRALALVDHRGETPVSGRVRLDVVGELEGLPPGTTVEVLGLLSRPSVAPNPGGFDFRQFLRERGIHTIIRCEFPAAVRVTKEAPGGVWRLFQSWQKTCADRLKARLSSANAPVAIALLLGPRTGISKELKDAFLHSGTVHFLAISGMNVAILVMFLWPWGRILRLSSRVQLGLIGVCVWGYVLITDADPPVVRAAVLVTMLLLSLSAGRRSAPLNHLALAGLIILTRNPHDLFQVGAQLSFLAILALHWLWCQPWFNSKTPADPLDELTQTWWQIAGAFLLRKSWEALVATTAVWIFTLPLILARFHLVSPVGFIVNVLLPFWMTLTLLFGYGCLLGVIVIPPLAWACAPCFDYGLTVFSSSVRFAASIPWGHFQLPGAPDWWLAVYYFLMVGIGSGLLSARLRPAAWRGILAWCVLGVVWDLPPQTNPGLRCTFLSVGHGAAILLEFPNRRTLLYDAGSLEDSARARMAVEGLLVERGLTRIDALLISHADIDHFNAVPGLLEDISIGEIFISPAFLDFRQASVTKVCEAAIHAGVPIKLIWAGDRLKCADDVTVEVLHPEGRKLSLDDNANSIVLSVQHAGRSILLTGDLEKDGLLTLLRQSPRPHDILYSPHHGSQKANPPELARWATPRWVVVSGGQDAAWHKLRESYGDGATLVATTKHGAITVAISKDGEIDVRTHLPPIPIVDPAKKP